MSHFQPVLERQGVDTSKIHSEFMSLRTALYLGAGWKKRLEGASWSQINRQYGDEFPNVLALIDLVLALPSSTADCERGFSAMKATKSDWRASLRSDTLSNLLMIKLESTDIALFDPTPAYDLWRTHALDVPKACRRPDYTSNRQPPKKKQKKDESVPEQKEMDVDTPGDDQQQQRDLTDIDDDDDSCGSETDTDSDTDFDN